ncbi:single-stranded DNA binding protein [uncultured Caudovirales phage]|jgi:hypothetical protein|uniref:Single-stranded DNA-binding protein n=1 Tax=uncultured Caudovirales phage TaxID=2100421 RepID=A0A6J5M5H6_9CAUD|nr:single-stranded DNA binding protein [uncultured Caudovirales phage]
MDFSKLKSQSKSSLEKLSQELSKMNQQFDNGKDDRFWQPNVDKAGNGFAVIRFLPSPGDEPVPFVRMWEHGFKGPSGQWYIEKSLTTINKPDPVSELNSKLWNMSSDDDSPSRKQVRAQKRKLNYICNIYVVQDQANPENNGKVFLFKFGKKLFDKINEAMHPQFSDEQPLNPFDLWAGANFKLKIRNVEGYRNYDKSEFGSSAPLFEDDEQMEAVWKREHSLQAFLAPENFKSYEELQTKLNKVLGINENGTAAPAAARAAAASRKPADDEDDLPWQAPKQERAASAPSNVSEDDDEDMAFFKKLAG